ncbi:MAG: NUDIX domain-containing protein [Chloroflexi bacterium]|nr:NUDIX domain-containing protein [Chloroflexota bacterium]
MEERATEVVTCFLRFQGKILLVKRSGRVGTYQGRWAGISGYLPVNADPLIHAYTEILEETGLDRDQVSLVKAGEPVAVEDPEGGRRWLVHPFLFETTTGQVKLDWENVALTWIDPREIGRHQTVPGLDKAYAAVGDG